MSSYFRLQRKYGDVLSCGDSGIFEGLGMKHITGNVCTTNSFKLPIKPCSPQDAITVSFSYGFFFFFF